MKKFYASVQRFIRNEAGVTAIEYALIASLIAIVIIAAVTITGTTLDGVFMSVCEALNGGTACTKP